MNFQDELRKNMRSPEEVIRENIAKETEALMAEATLTLFDIKKALISNVKNAKYSTQDDVKTVSCVCKIPQRFLHRHSENNSEQLRQNQQKFFLFRDPSIVYCTWECFEIEPKYSDEYYQYVDALKKLATLENIKVEIIIHDATDNKDYSFPIKLKRFYSVNCYLSVRATTKIT